MTLVPGRCLTTRAPTFWQSPGVPRRPNPQSPREQLLNSNRSGDGKMGLAAWALFFPDSADASVVFHGARHAVIVGLVFLALRATPGIFALFLALLSVLEYTRHSRARVLATVHVCVCLAFWLAARPTKSVPGAPPFFLRRLVFRSSVIFAPFVVDKVLVEKVGLAPAITDLLFPLAMGAANEVLSLVDPLGIAVNLGSLCCDYPEVTFVPLRFGGLSVQSGAGVDGCRVLREARNGNQGETGECWRCRCGAWYDVFAGYCGSGEGGEEGRDCWGLGRVRELH